MHPPLVHLPLLAGASEKLHNSISHFVQSMRGRSHIFRGQSQYLTKYSETLQADHMLQAAVAMAAATVWGHEFTVNSGSRDDTREAFSFSHVTFKLCVWVLSRFSCVRLFATLWAIAHQAALSMGFCRQECWSGLPCPPPGDSS